MATISNVAIDHLEMRQFFVLFLSKPTGICVGNRSDGLLVGNDVHFDLLGKSPWGPGESLSFEIRNLVHHVSYTRK